MISGVNRPITSLAALWGGKDASANREKPATATANREAQDAADRALDALKRANRGQAAQRKAAAKQKIERIKKQLEALRMFGGDPKAVAREAARLARELKSAVKDFAAGSSSGVGESGGTPANGEASAPDGEKAQAALAPNFQELAAEIQRRAGDSRADAEFRGQARSLFHQLKTIFERERDRAVREGSADGDFDHFAAEFRSAGQALGDIGGYLGGVGAPTGGLDILV